MLTLLYAYYRCFHEPTGMVNLNLTNLSLWTNCSSSKHKSPFVLYSDWFITSCSFKAPSLALPLLLTQMVLCWCLPCSMHTTAFPWANWNGEFEPDKSVSILSQMTWLLMQLHAELPCIQVFGLPIFPNLLIFIWWLLITWLTTIITSHLSLCYH